MENTRLKTMSVRAGSLQSVLQLQEWLWSEKLLCEDYSSLLCVINMSGGEDYTLINANTDKVNDMLDKYDGRVTVTHTDCYGAMDGAIKQAVSTLSNCTLVTAVTYNKDTSEYVCSAILVYKDSVSICKDMQELV